MPNRMLRDWTDSLRFDGLSADAERLFTRLIMKADDYGRFHADSRLIRAACFPLIDNLRTNDLDRWLIELSNRQLILRYEADGRSCIAIVNYGQRLKSSKAKFPPFPGESADWLPTSGSFHELPETSGNFRELPARREEKRSRREAEAEGGIENPPAEYQPPLDFKKEKPDSAHRRATFDQVSKFGRGQMPPIPDECCEKFFDRMEADGWINSKGFPLNDWRARFREWAGSWASNSAKPNGGKFKA